MRSVISALPEHCADESTESQPYKILRFQANAEPQEETPSAAELRLEAEARALRAALQDAQRELARYETLLRNAQLRERELRAELLKGK